MFLFVNTENKLIFHFKAPGTVVGIKWDKLGNKTFCTACKLQLLVLV